MPQIDPNEFLEELKFCLYNKDIIKARALLQFAKHASIPLYIQKQALEEIAGASQSMRLPLLNYLTGLNISHPDIKNRINALIIENNKPDRKKTKIYVVDDSLMMQTMMEKKLKGLGYRAKIFSSHEDAVNLAFKAKPDIMIIDWHMPQINGLNLTSIIREKYDDKELPIVMILPQNDFTVTDQDDLFFLNAPLMEQAGVSKTLQKPFTDDMLQEALSCLLDQVY